MFAKLMQHLSHKELLLKRGEKVYAQGESPQGIYLLQEGLVGLAIIGAKSGKEHLLRFFRAGQFFGHRSLFSGEGYHGNAIALETTKLLFISKEGVLQYLEAHPADYKEVITVLAKELRHCENQRVLILENQILPRVAQALVYLKDLHPEHQWTRQEIADFCGSTASTVIKTMGGLEDQGYIRQVTREIQILDRPGLIALQDQE